MERTQRNSAIELLRLGTILLIIFHHFNVHGLWQIVQEGGNWPTINLFISALTGWGGNTGNEIFMIITGYYMINSRVHWKRILLLLASIFFYSWLIASVFYGVLDVPFRGKDLSKAFFPIWSGRNWFVCCYLVFMCFVPFINLFLNRLSRTQYQACGLLNYVMFILIPVFHGETYMNGKFIQFFIMYMLGGYIRLYGFQSARFQSTGFWRKIIGILAALLLIGALFPTIFGHWGPYNRIVSLIEVPMALSCFMIALLHRPFSSPMLNTLAGSVLGIYLIHDNPLVRSFFWREWFPNIDYFQTEYFVLFMIGKVLIVFLVCLGIDLAKRRVFDPWMERYLDAHWGTWKRAVLSAARRMSGNFCGR